MTSEYVSETEVHAAEPAPVPPTPTPPICSVCPHPWDAHDRLGVRYCSATMASAQTRGCICRPAVPPRAARP